MTHTTDRAGAPDLAALEQLAETLRETAGRSLQLLGGTGPGDREAAAASLALAAAIGQIERVAHGLHLQALAQADRVKAARGGIGPWLAARQGYATGHARALAHDARLLATVPQLAPHLPTGHLSPDATRLLARTVKACTHTGIDPATHTGTILQLLHTEGPGPAADHVRALEHRLDPDKAKTEHERHRHASKAGSTRLENGLWRFEILLDPARAAVLKTALDTLTAHWMRTNGRDGIQILPEDVKTTEQITAHAFHHLATVFLNAPTHIREAAFTPPVIFTAPLPDTTTNATATGNRSTAETGAGAETGVETGSGTMQNPAPDTATATATNTATATAAIGAVRDPVSDTAGAAFRGGGLDGAIPDGSIPHACALSAYNDLIPLTALTPTPPNPQRNPAQQHDSTRPHDPARPDGRARHRILHYDREHRPVLLDGQPIDRDPHTRLASPAQRTALAVRDRTCTHPGCDRPFTWSLEAHHLTPHSQGGPTNLANLTSLCAQHHRDLHHPDRD